MPDAYNMQMSTDNNNNNNCLLFYKQPKRGAAHFGQLVRVFSAARREFTFFS